MKRHVVTPEGVALPLIAFNHSMSVCCAVQVVVKKNDKATQIRNILVLKKCSHARARVNEMR